MIAIGCDHGGYDLKQRVIKYLEEHDIAVKDVGCYSKESCDFYFPSIAKTEEVVVGINSSGQNPKTTKRIREQIENLLECDSIYQQ